MLQAPRDGRLPAGVSPTGWASLADLTAAARFVGSLPGLLRHPLSPAACREELRRRLAGREAAFLHLARRAVFPNRSSPYRRLLALAGCEYGDLERLVATEGLEGALLQLLRQGIYLTVDEFKGRQAVVRGSQRFCFDPRELANPLAGRHLAFRSSGSRGPGTVVAVEAAFFRDRAVNTGLALEARGGLDWRHLLWIVPGGAAMLILLPYAKIGRPPAAWFSQVDPARGDLDRRYAWSARLLRWTARAVGRRLPAPRYAPLSQPLAVAAWLRDRLQRGQTPHLLTFPSSAVALARAAGEAGLDLRGAQLSIGGEPITPVRLALLRQAGLEPLPHYGCIETGFLGEGCLAPSWTDEVHLFDDLHAVVQPGPEAPSETLPERALLISALSPTAPLLLLNVSLGDQADLVERVCGCPLERLGWRRHLSNIRSFEKLTAGGMTFLDADALRALEEVLPARFGGAPIDYQLLEAEAREGRPELVLLVSPRVGRVDLGAVRSAFLAELGAGSAAGRLGALLWEQAGFLRIERRQPLAGASGKIQHLHAGPGAARPTSGSARR